MTEGGAVCLPVDRDHDTLVKVVFTDSVTPPSDSVTFGVTPCVADCLFDHASDQEPIL
jgi:hypothetical protein